MTTKFLRGYRAEVEAGEGEPQTYSFIASTSGVKRDGLEIDQSAWQLDGYRSNPVVLLNHDYSSLPLGTAEVEVRDGSLMADVTWSEANPAADQVRALYDEGTLRAVSVGWRDTEDGHELLDISAVAVPGDPAALIQRTRAWAEEVLEPDETPDVEDADEFEPLTDDEFGVVDMPTVETWDEIAAGMVAVFDVAADADDDERQRAYKDLLPAYRKHGKTPPEYMLAATVAAFEPREWRGLFLEGELVACGHRAGMSDAGTTTTEDDFQWLADLAAEVETEEQAAEVDLLAQLYGGLQTDE